MRARDASVIAVALLSGCSSTHSHFSGQYGAQASSGQQGLYVSVGLGETAAEVLFGGAMLGIYLAGLGYGPGPESRMREDRLINEQDCTKPIVQPTANLRCR